MIPCFLIEDQRRSRYTLRRYSDGRCPQRLGYHNAHSAVVDERPDDPTKDYCGTNPPPVDAQDSRWPTACACGYAFTEDDRRQVFAHPLYRRGDTGEVYALEDAPAGAIWEATWWHDKGADGKGWCVRLPDGSDWLTESKAGNCNCPADPAHRCWARTGTAPTLTVSPSIATPRWHGWLRAGRLEDA